MKITEVIIQKLTDKAYANYLKKKNRNKVGRSRMPKHPTPPGFPSFLGGDPSAGSPPDTLLRLNPPRRRQARIPHREVASPTHN